MGLRRRDHDYRAVRRGSRRWDLEVDGHVESSYPGFREAERAAAAHDRRSRTRVAVLRHLLVLMVVVAVAVPAVLLREVSNPDYGPARGFADRMEAAYRSIDSGETVIGDYSVEVHGFEGGVFEVDRGGVVADYLVLTGAYREDCYVLRWVRGEVPFVARLLPGYPCVPGDRTLSFNPAGFEAIAVNLSSEAPLRWEPVLPPEVKLATWFLPAALVLLFVVMQQLVGLSLVFIRGVPTAAVRVERIEEWGE